MNGKYSVFLSNDARRDIDKLSNIIMYDYQAPDTAFKYVQGLLNAITSLKKSPEIYAIQTRKSLRQYGYNVRRINYKKMAIIYSVYNDVVLVHRIVPSTLITEL